MPITLFNVSATISRFLKRTTTNDDKTALRGDLAAAPLASPSFTGTPTAPTATLGTNTTQVATTAFANTAATAAASLASGDKAPINSPNFTGTPTAVTPSLDNSSNRLATTEFVTGFFAGAPSGIKQMIHVTCSGTVFADGSLSASFIPAGGSVINVSVAVLIGDSVSAWVDKTVNALNAFPAFSEVAVAVALDETLFSIEMLAGDTNDPAMAFTITDEFAAISASSSIVTEGVAPFGSPNRFSALILTGFDHPVYTVPSTAALVSVFIHQNGTIQLPVSTHGETITFDFYVFAGVPTFTGSGDDVVVFKDGFTTFDSTVGKMYYVKANYNQLAGNTYGIWFVEVSPSYTGPSLDP